MERLQKYGAWLGLLALACGGQAQADGAAHAGGAGTAETGGSETAPISGVPSGGNATGGASTGGASAGGTSSGKSTGGRTNTGGIPSGGTSAGGTTSGGKSSGGRTNTGGTPSGGASAGGTTGSGGSTGGTPAGGASGGRTTGGGAVGGSSTSGAGSGGFIAGGAGGAHTGGTAGSGGTSLDCQVAVRIDHCCSQPIAVESKAFEDPCVLPYRSYFTREELAGCPDAEKCLMVNCTHPAPPSRVARLSSGECVFDDECLAAAAPYNFCSIATDYNRCCSCPEVFPQVVVAADPCLLTEGVPEPGTCADCSAVDCAACNAPKPSLYCDYDSVTQLSVCRGRTQ